MVLSSTSVGIWNLSRFASDMIVPITDPGGMLFTVMPSGPSSCARVRVMVGVSERLA